MTNKKINLILVSGWGTGTSHLYELAKEFSNDINICQLCWSEVLASPNDVIAKHCQNGMINLLLGWSLGAELILDAASSGNLNCQGIFVISSTARMCEDDNYHGTSSKVLRAMKIKLKRTPQRLFADFATLALAPQKDEDIITHFCQEATTFDYDKLHDGLEYLQNQDLRSSLKNIEQPVHLLHGEDDQVIFVDNAKYLKKHLTNCQLTTITGGHFLPIIEKDLMKKYLWSFLDAYSAK